MSEPAAARPASPEAPAARPKVGFFELDPLDNRYPVLHGLRFWAILSVVQYHITFILAREQRLPLNQTFTDSILSVFFGMDMFFLLSGFLIGSILLRSLEVHGSQKVWRFYVRRIFRTFPSYYVVLTFLALIMPMTEARSESLIYEYVYLTNFTTLQRDELVMYWGWSLALEEQFYLTVPVLMLVLHRLRGDRARILMLVALCLVALATRLGIYFEGSPWDDLPLYRAVYFRTYTRFDAILVGIILAIVEMQYGARIGKWLEHPFHRALLAVPSLGCLWVVVNPAVFGDEHAQLTRMFVWGTMTSLMYFPALLLMLHGDGWIQRFLGRPIFRRAATLGYGVYLVHIPIIDYVIVPAAHGLSRVGVSMWVVWPLGLAVVTLGSFVIAYGLHILVEKPSLQLRDRLAA